MKPTRRKDAWDELLDPGTPLDRRILAGAVATLALAVLYLLLSTPLRSEGDGVVVPATGSPAVQYEETP